MKVQERKKGAMRKYNMQCCYQLYNCKKKSTLSPLFSLLEFHQLTFLVKLLVLPYFHFCQPHNMPWFTLPTRKELIKLTDSYIVQGGCLLNYTHIHTCMHENIMYRTVTCYASAVLFVHVFTIVIDWSTM